jgi:transglutaminase-like putative cysteine protease
MRSLLVCFLVAAGFFLGCKPPKSGEAAKSEPSFVVETWEGRKSAGPIALSEGQLTVEGRRLALSDIQTIARETPSGAPRIARVAGFEPLSDADLTRYRARALETARRFGGSTYIVCLDQGQETLMPNTHQVSLYHGLILILKEEGRRAGDIALGFEEGRSRRAVVFARSISPDGRSQWLDPATLQVAVPQQSDAFLNPRLRTLSGRIPGVEVGSMVEFVTESTVYNPEVPDYFFPDFRFRDEEPTLDSIFDVRVPAGRRLNCTTRNFPEAARQPRRSARGGFDVYHWELHDVPPYVAEPMMPDPYDIVPLVQCSLFFDWRELVERTGNFQRERIQTTPEITELARRISQGATNDDQRVAALYHWVQRNIRYLSIKGSLSSGWAGHTATETLRNGYGDCTDKAILFASLCQALGIRSYPAILRTNDAGTAITDIPVPDANHCINLVFPNGKPRFLDSTDSDCRYPYFREDDHGAKAILFMTGEILQIPVPPPEDNERQSVQKIDLAADGSAAAVENNSYNGSYESAVRGFWRSKEPDMRPRLMQQDLQRRCPGAVITDFKLSDLDDLNKPLTMELRYRIPSQATRVRDLYIASIPGFARDFPSATLATREFPIVRTTTQAAHNTIQIACPPGYQLVGVPEPLTIHGKHLGYEGKVTPAPDGKSLAVEENFKVLTRVVPTEDYAAYRAESARIAAWTRLKLVFRKTTP